MAQLKQRTYPVEAALSLSQAGIDPVLARILAARGVAEPEDMDLSMAGLISPSEMLNADLAARILTEAIITDRHIVVLCDFDVDGCSAGAIAMRGLTMMGAKRVNTAMPLREKHGYGASKLLAQEIHAKYAPDLILTVDCGISSFAPMMPPCQKQCVL